MLCKINFISIKKNKYQYKIIMQFITVAPSQNKVGLFYQPKIGFRTDELDVFIGCKNISVESSNYSTVYLGINYIL
jgi:hypothetical protein